MDQILWAYLIFSILVSNGYGLKNITRMIILKALHQNLNKVNNIRRKTPSFFFLSKEDDKGHPMTHSHFFCFYCPNLEKKYRNEWSIKNPFAWKLISQTKMIDALFKDKKSWSILWIVMLIIMISNISNIVSDFNVLDTILTL